MLFGNIIHINNFFTCFNNSKYIVVININVLEYAVKLKYSLITDLELNLKCNKLLRHVDVFVLLSFQL